MRLGLGVGGRRERCSSALLRSDGKSSVVVWSGLLNSNLINDNLENKKPNGLPVIEFLRRVMPSRSAEIAPGHLSGSTKSTTRL